MKVTGQYKARKAYSNGSHFIMIQVTDKKDASLLDRLFKTKAERDKRRGSESLLHITFDLPYRSKSYKQLRTIFALVTAIFVSMDGRLPTEEEKYNLYLDLLDAYGMKAPSKLDSSRLRVIHMSEANTFEAAYFINELMLHLATECELTLDLQTDVQNLLWEWTMWRGGEICDPLDYWDKECTRPIDETEWRRRHPYSEASGLTDPIHLHHIVTRGAHPYVKDEVWNWCALTHEEHTELHQRGEKVFLKKYPHLAGKFKRAHRKADRNE
ncbi:hypothetical protein [Treponema pedis]|uniref:hypothetical protein n=1 Tax=Treponema pedis TaxID=409322 RepID=UPI003D192BEC